MFPLLYTLSCQLFPESTCPNSAHRNTPQDLGNTNFSIHVPRTSFDRGATAQVVLRAVRALGIDAHVNERNDICVGGEKASGSAYKIVSGRAYHHGTMLITTKLETLGDLLRVNKVFDLRLCSSFDK